MLRVCIHTHNNVLLYLFLYFVTRIRSKYFFKSKTKTTDRKSLYFELLISFHIISWQSQITVIQYIFHYISRNISNCFSFFSIVWCISKLTIFLQTFSLLSLSHEFKTWFWTFKVRTCITWRTNKRTKFSLVNKYTICML